MLIDDEILVGCGRTGKMFAIDHYGITPDILLLGKALGSGYPIGALVSTDQIMSSEPSSFPSSWTTSFGSNPLACSAALATLEVISEEKLVENASMVGEYMLKRLKKMQERHELIGDVRGKGLLIGIELVKNRRTKEEALNEAKKLFMASLKRGLLIFPFSHILRINPPLCISKEIADIGLDILEDAFLETEKF